MKKWALIFLVLTALKLPAQTNGLVRLAIVSESAEARTAADVLTAQLSSNGKVQLLERDQIQKVYRELGLSAANRDDLKLGRILGADGLLLLNVVHTHHRTNLAARLIAVKPGVILSDINFPWPLKDTSSWARFMATYLDPFLPKMAVLAKDAIPISVVNFHAPITSASELETERELKLVTIQCLSLEQRFFVLERQKMQLLSREKSFDSDKSPFWDGSYLLAGNIDQKGYSPNVVTINAQLTPPKGGTPLDFEVSGSRTNLAEVVNRLAAKVAELLNVHSTIKEWRAAREAEQYFREAQWAMRWRIYPEAQAAAEAAWALGRHNPETATLRICAYSQSVPLQAPNSNYLPDTIFQKQISVLAIPNRRQFKPLLRAMDLFCQDAPDVLGSKNKPDPAGFLIGLQLLRRAAGLLESYYYAAELRADNPDQLVDLRRKMRLMLSTLDTYTPLDADKHQRWSQLQQDYNWLKWEEGGICFDRPENALPMYRRLLAAGYQPKDLPRLVGWSWKIRQRVPNLMRQFVAGICAETNPAERLQGLYLALLLAPHDGKGTLRWHETALVLAMWKNRRWLLNDAGNASLVEQTRETLRSKYDDGDPYKYYDHEPFGSFQQLLRMDFLEHAAEPKLGVFETLFPITTEQTESSAEARQLLPLVIQCEKKLHLDPTWGVIPALRQLAGVPENSPSQPVKAVLPAQKVLEAKFIKWNLLRPGLDSERLPNFRRMIFRNGKLWLEAWYLSTNTPDNLSMLVGQPGLPVLETKNVRTTFLEVDPRKGVQKEIPFPARLGLSTPSFEVAPDSLFVIAHGHLYRFKFRDRTWEEIPAPVEDSSQLVWLKGNLFISRSDGLLEVNPQTKKVKILVSSRRRPALNKIDPMWPALARLYPRSDGKLGVLSENHCFCFDPDTGQWYVRTLPVAGAKNYFNFSTFFTSAEGAQILLTGSVAHRYLVGYWNNNQPPESLLMEVSPIQIRDSANERLLQPVRWDWPKGFPLEPSSIVAGNHQLWVLCPRKVWQNTPILSKEPVKFSDNRQATLFCFDPKGRRPCWSVPIRFPDSNQAVVFKLRINGRTAEPLSPAEGGFMVNWFRLVHHAGNAVFWFKTPEGLVFGAPNYCGHWLIPMAALEARRQTQKQFLNPLPNPQAQASTPLPKP